MILLSDCPKCGRGEEGKLTCCGRQGSWQGKCGTEGSAKFKYTFKDGLKACAKSARGAKNSALAMGEGLKVSYVRSQTLSDKTVSAGRAHAAVTATIWITSSGLLFLSHQVP